MLPSWLVIGTDAVAAFRECVVHFRPQCCRIIYLATGAHNRVYARSFYARHHAFSCWRVHRAPPGSLARIDLHHHFPGPSSSGSEDEVDASTLKYNFIIFHISHYHFLVTLIRKQSKGFSTFVLSIHSIHGFSRSNLENRKHESRSLKVLE